MAQTSPVVEFRTVASPNGVITGQAMSGAGFAGAIPAGTNSTIVSVRIYNNFAGAASIADATGCVLAVYDDAIHQGTAINLPSTGLYVQVQVQDYNGNTTGADSLYFAIGGQTKHALPTNSGTISGNGANYVTVNVQVVVPSNAAQGSVSQGLWIEYTATA